MKNKTKIAKLLLYIIVLLFACTTKESEVILEKRIQYHYQIWISKMDSIDLRDSVQVFSAKWESENVEQYKLGLLKNQKLGLFVEYSIHNDSLFLHDNYCAVIDTANIHFKKDSIRLYKSHFDIPEVHDEESYIYWDHEYGIIAKYNYPWGGLLIFKPEEIKGFAQNEFYKYLITEEWNHYYNRHD